MMFSLMKACLPMACSATNCKHEHDLYFMTESSDINNNDKLFTKPTSYFSIIISKYLIPSLTAPVIFSGL